MSRVKVRLTCLLGLMAIVMALVLIAPFPANAMTYDKQETDIQPTLSASSESPDIFLLDMTSIAETPKKASSDCLTDNYGNTYGSAIYNYDWHYLKYEYLLDGKYSRFTGTLYVVDGANRDEGVTLTIKADGREIYHSPLMTKTSKPVDIDVSVKGHNDVVIEFSEPHHWVPLGLAYAGFHLVKPSETDPVNRSGVNIFRMYNPYSGEHLYTTDTNEADSLLSGGWNWENTSSVPKSGNKVYRLCNPYSGEHLYTTSLNEYKTLSGGGWNGEGEKFYSSDSSGKPFYRLYNPWGSGVTAHTYTTDQNEVNTLTRGGWKSDGVCWYGLW